MYYTCSDVAYLRIVTVVILLLEATSVVLADTQHLMRLPCLATVVDMNFQKDSQISWVYHESMSNITIIIHVLLILVCSLGYALWMTENIVKSFPGSDLYIMYDIACSSMLKVIFFCYRYDQCRYQASIVK